MSGYNKVTFKTKKGFYKFKLNKANERKLKETLNTIESYKGQ